MFDLIITGGRIIDGRGRKPFPGKIGIQDGRIVAWGDFSGRARRRIRAEGRVICPGFIDIHSHSDYQLLVNPRADSKIRQGVTMEVGGNCGYSAAPVSREVAREREKSFPDYFRLRHDWRSVSEYLTRLERKRISVNFALLTGYNTVRATVMGGEARAPSKSEQRAITSHIETALEEGGAGISVGLAYPPACFSRKSELVALGRLAKKWGVIFSAHIRSEGRGLLPALDEFLEVGRITGANLEISHLKTLGEENWGKLEQMLEKIQNEIKAGVAVTADRYPYLAANTSLASLLPEWALAGSPREILARVRSTQVFQRLVKEIRASHPERGFWKRVIISSTCLKKNSRWEGMDLETAGGKDPVSFALRLLKNDNFFTSIFVFAMSEDNLDRILTRPWTMIASDGAVQSLSGPLRWNKSHPRAFGTFPRVFEEYVRGKKLISLEKAVYKMTGMPARKMGLRNRGIIKPGNWADLVVFSPDRIADKSSYAKPCYPSGIDFVIVNGQVTVEKGEHTGARNGRVIRRNEMAEKI